MLISNVARDQTLLTLVWAELPLDLTRKSHIMVLTAERQLLVFITATSQLCVGIDQYFGNLPDNSYSTLLPQPNRFHYRFCVGRVHLAILDRMHRAPRHYISKYVSGIVCSRISVVSVQIHELLGPRPVRLRGQLQRIKRHESVQSEGL